MTNTISCNHKFRIALAVAMGMIVLCGIAHATPTIPDDFYGSVTINGAPAPAGTMINATINGLDRGSIITTQPGIYATNTTLEPKLSVYGLDDEIGETIIFFVNGRPAEEQAVFQSYAATMLNLTMRFLISNFTANRTSGLTPLAIRFTDTTTCNPISWNWSFGDGNFSSLQNPVHVYVFNGTFTVALNASNAVDANTSVKIKYINASMPPPIANFTANVLSGPMPLAVQFNDTSARLPMKWNWSFGDGTFSLLQNPVHVYAVDGTYSVSLNATNHGGSNTTTKPGYITVTVVPPVANFTANVTSGPIPLAVQFTDTSTSSPATWNWSFGDGTGSTISNPVCTYTSPGNFTVALNVTNPGGYSQTVRTAFITTWIKGDLNRNLRVDINDVTRVAYMAAGLVSPDPLADFNGDHAVDVSDASIIAWYYVGKIPKL